MKEKNRRLVSIVLVVAVLGVSVMAIATAILFQINGDRTGEFAATSAPPEQTCISSNKACVGGGGCYCGSQYGSATCVHNAICGGSWCSSINCSGTSQPTPTNPGQPPTSTPVPTICKNNGTVVTSQSQCCSKYGQSITGGFICATSPVTSTPTVGRCGAGYTDGICGGGTCNGNQRLCYANSFNANTCISDPLCIQTTPVNQTPTPTTQPTAVSSNPQAPGTNRCGDASLFENDGVCGQGTAQNGCDFGQLKCLYKNNGGVRCFKNKESICPTPTPTPLYNNCGSTATFNDSDICGGTPQGDKCLAGELQCTYKSSPTSVKCVPNTDICVPPTQDQVAAECQRTNPGSSPAQCFDGKRVCSKDGSDSLTYVDDALCNDSRIGLQTPDQICQAQYGINFRGGGCDGFGNRICVDGSGYNSLALDVSCPNDPALQFQGVQPTVDPASSVGQDTTGFIPSGTFAAVNWVFANSIGTLALLAFIIISSLFGITILVYQAVNTKTSN